MAPREPHSMGRASTLNPTSQKRKLGPRGRPAALQEAWLGWQPDPSSPAHFLCTRGGPMGTSTKATQGFLPLLHPREILWRRAQHPRRLQTAAWTAPALRRWRWLFLSRRSGSSQLSAARHPQVSVGGGGTLADPGVKDRVNTIQVDCLGGSS